MKLLFRVVEVTKSLSNLIKSGFVAFAKDAALVVDANRNRIIQAIDSSAEHAAAEESEDAVLAEALIRDAELDMDGDVLTLDAGSLGQASDAGKESGETSDELLRNAKEEAEQILAQAHEEAEQMRASAYDEADAIRREAKDAGFQEGYQEGTTQADAEYQKRKAELEVQEQNNRAYIETESQRLQEEVEHKMVDLLCELIPSVTGVVIEDQRDVLVYMINAAMQDLDNSRHFVIRVSPVDYEAVYERREDIYGAGNPNIEIEIFEDARLHDKQCLIDTDNGIVNISLDVQLENLMKAMRLIVKE